MGSKKVVEALNKARARELQVVVQYMLQHYAATGIESLPVAEMFKATAIAEMKHAEALGERIDYLGGVPVKAPHAEPTPGKSLRNMLEIDLKAEEDAIALYRDIVKLCDKEGDVTSRRLMEGLLGDEEGHANEFKTALGK